MNKSTATNKTVTASLTIITIALSACFDQATDVAFDASDAEGYEPYPILSRTGLEIESRTMEDLDRKSTRLNSSHTDISRMPSSA